MRPISYEVHGFPEFLRSEESCRRAIDRGTLTASTPVTVYGEAGDRSRVVASQHPVLRAMLGIADETPAPEPIVAPPEPTVLPITPRASATPVLRATPIEPQFQTPAREPIPRAAPAAGATGRPSNQAEMVLPFRRYAEISGRSGRREYWLFVLLCLVVSTVAVSLRSQEISSPVSFFALFWVFTVVPAFAVHIRRLHDIGQSGWLLLVGLIPYVGAFILFVMMCLEGTRGANRYGPDPKQR